MSTRALTVLMRCLLLVALAACAALFVDYQTAGAGGFCGEVAVGCGKIKNSAYSGIFGIKWPTIGLVAMPVLLSLSVWARSDRGQMLFTVAAVAGGFTAAGLIGLQVFVEDAICKWCMGVDIPSILVAIIAVVLYRRGDEVAHFKASESRGMRVLWVAAALAAAAVPLTWEPEATAAELPPEVLEFYSDDKVDVVMFTDFQCPHCRKLHPVLDEFAKDNPGRVKLTRLMKPLAGHPGAKPAALAYLCTPPGKQEEMADKLYNGKVGELNAAGVVRFAADIGIDPNAVASCMVDQRTLGRLAEDEARFKKAALRGLPSTFIEQELVIGSDIPKILTAMDRALAGNSASGGTDIRYMLALLAILIVAMGAAGLMSGATEGDDDAEGAAKGA